MCKHFELKIQLMRPSGWIPTCPKMSSPGSGWVSKLQSPGSSFVENPVNKTYFVGILLSGGQAFQNYFEPCLGTGCWSSCGPPPGVRAMLGLGLPLARVILGTGAADLSPALLSAASEAGGVREAEDRRRAEGPLHREPHQAGQVSEQQHPPKR